MAGHSFRRRLLLASLFLAIGLVPLVHLGSVLLIRQHRVELRLENAVVVLIVALLCVAAGVAGIRNGLTPFDNLRARLSAFRDGRDPRIMGSYPDEVQPLVDDLNALLENREGIVRRALAKAGDLAHGLKTPLALLSLEAERASAAGHPELATAIGQQVERMRRQVDYHLAQARAAASGATPGAHCPVLDSAEALSRTLLRLHAGRGLTIDLDVPSHHPVRGQREDLDEMLGNLMDNACKWASSRISIKSSEANGMVVVDIDDDGPGLDPSMRELVLQRGVRADEAAPGFGLGLAIVRDLAELYGGSVSLVTSPSGGLRASLQMPTA